MNPEATPDSITLLDTSREDLQHQLYRYAQDLQDLMEQHSTLQQRHSQVLESLGSGDVDDDQLLKVMLEPTAVYLVTSSMGDIRFISPAAERALGLIDRMTLAHNILQLMPPEQARTTQALLDSLAAGTGSGAAHQRQLRLCNTTVAAQSRLFGALIMQARSQGEVRTYWILCEQGQRLTAALDVLTSFSFFESATAGLIVTDPHAHICAVNRRFALMSGYSQDELAGENPRKLRAGLQDAEFYQIFWRQLNNSGHWRGELFNRHKDGHIYFAWITIRAVKNSSNTTVFYLAAYDDKSPRGSDLAKLTQLSYHEPQTGMPNRRLLEHRLAMMMADPSCKKTGLYVLLLDLTHFQSISDTLDPPAAELLMREIGARLQSSVRRADTVAHIQGGEFVILLPGVVDKRDALSVANAIRLKLKPAFKVAGQAAGQIYDLGAHFGAASFPKHGEDVMTVFKHAEAVLAQVKNAAQGIHWSQRHEH